MADATNLRSHLLRWAADVHAYAVEHTVEALRDAAPEKTGETKREIRAVPQSSPGTFATDITSPTPQGEWAEHGTAPHVIEGNPLLAFQWNGKLTIVRHVHHPGTAAKPWFHPTLIDAWPRTLQEAAGVFN